jgi:hypothetical protein
MEILEAFDLTGALRGASALIANGFSGVLV